MGVILKDSIELPTKINVSDTYYGLVSIISLSKKNGKYIVGATFGQWASEDARDTRAQPIGIKKIELKYDEPPTGNIYDLVYTELIKSLGENLDSRM